MTVKCKILMFLPFNDICMSLLLIQRWWYNSSIIVSMLSLMGDPSEASNNPSARPRSSYFLPQRDRPHAKSNLCNSAIRKPLTISFKFSDFSLWLISPVCICMYYLFVNSFNKDIYIRIMQLIQIITQPKVSIKHNRI